MCATCASKGFQSLASRGSPSSTRWTGTVRSCSSAGWSIRSGCTISGVGLVLSPRPTRSWSTSSPPSRSCHTDRSSVSQRTGREKGSRDCKEDPWRSEVNGPGNPKVVVVTGASSGVGRAIVQALAGPGVKLGLIARNEEALEATANEVTRAGGEALVLPLDVTDAEAVERAAAAVEAQWGRIDVWVNNAMATVFAPVTQTTAEEYRRVMEVTYLGYVHGTLAALRQMRPHDEGTIIQIGSALAYRSIPLQSAYCAAKAAVRAFTDSLRSELIHDGSGVRLCMLQLPAVNTPQAVRQRNKLPRQAQPMPPMFSPESIADVIVRSIEHGPREMLMGLPTI